MPSIDFKLLRAQVSMAQVLEIIGFVANESSGVQRRGPCPIHRSTTTTSRSFSVNLGRNLFQCFRCGAKGNQLDLYAAVTGLRLHRAALDLCARLAMTPPLLRPKSPRGDDMSSQPGTGKRNT